MIKISEKRITGTEYKLIAEYDGRYVGKLVYELFVFDTKSAMIIDLTILADMRRKGIATSLVEAAIEKIFARSYMNRILIQDGSDNGATERIARKFGFIKDGSKFGYELIRRLAQR